MENLPILLYAIIAFITGAVLGSFLNVCISRIPKDESIISPPSHCTSCGTSIRFYDNIPIFSWLILGGKCRQCQERISIRYILVEILMALLAAGLVLHLGIQLLTLVYLVFTAALVVVFFIDLDHKIIPDIITIPGIFIDFLCAGFFIGFLNSGLGILIGGAGLFLPAFLYQLFTGRKGMGSGDIKLLAMIGAFIGWEGVLFTLFVSALTGAMTGLFIAATQKKGMKLAIPFGPFLSASAILYIFCGPFLIEWYLRLISVG